MASGKKDQLARYMALSGITFLAAKRAGRRRAALSILAYHRIYDMGPEDAFPFDPELVSATPADFEWQMRELARHYHPIGLGTAAALLESGGALPEGAVAVTFDDGHRDNYTHAFPIVAALRMPATIFVSTGYIGTAGTFWFDETAHALYSSPRLAVRVESLNLDLPLGDIRERRAAASRLLGVLKRVPDARRRAALQELRTAAGVGEVRDARSGVMTWEQVREMSAAGIEFGSHTVSHPILSRIDDSALEEEIGGSKRELEARLGKPTPLIAYPVGGQDEYDDRTVRVARECGYLMGLSYVPGTAQWPPLDRFGMPRLHVERYTTRERFAAMLALPTVFA